TADGTTRLSDFLVLVQGLLGCPASATAWLARARRLERTSRLTKPNARISLRF
ncbi:11660_t:CDS:1, partial [Racocetra persica]